MHHSNQNGGCSPQDLARSIADALKGRPKGKGYRAVCPACGKKKDTLSVWVDDHGKLAINCYRCGHDAAKAALIGRGLLPDNPDSYVPAPRSQAEIERDIAARERAQQAKREEVAGKARAVWDSAKPAPADHPYLELKQIKPDGARVDGQGQLIFPLRDIDGVLWTFQYITPELNKLFLNGGKKKGNFFLFGDMENAERILICEGWATGASIYGAVSKRAVVSAVVVAFDASNLFPVSTVVREKHPEVAITVCADDDWKTEGNPGMEKGAIAAQAVGGLLAVPEFGPDREDKETDFNDMECRLGWEAVANQIDRARPPPHTKEKPRGGQSSGAQNKGKSTMQSISQDEHASTVAGYKGNGGTKQHDFLPDRRNDSVNADRLVAQHGNNLIWVPGIGWFVWDSQRWVRDEKRRVYELAKQTALSIFYEIPSCRDQKDMFNWYRQSQQRHRLESMVALAQSREGIATLVDDLDADPMAFVCGNGTIDLRTGELRESRRTDLCTYASPIRYDPEAYSMRWEDFLHEIFDSNDVLIGYVQRAFGYSMTGDVTAQVVFIPYGHGANGKSTLMDVIRRVLGGYMRPAAPSLLMASKSDRHPSEIAQLRGKRLVTAIESTEGKAFDEERIKWFTGGDRLTARFMNRDWFDFDPTAKFWIATNHKPIVRGTDLAIWRRLHLIPFTVTIPEGKRDPKLTEKLAKDAPAILNWMVQGCLQWQEQGLNPPKIVTDATAEYRTEMDTLGEFLAEETKVNRDGFVTSHDLYVRYKIWCEQGGMRPMFKRTLGLKLKDRGYVSGTRHNHRGWKDIGLI